ncbi:MAG: hypothetical protein ACRDFX_06200 [Chloroflexota bacterium]
MAILRRKLANGRSALVGLALAFSGGSFAVVSQIVPSGTASDRAAIEQLVHGSQLAEQTLCLAPSSIAAAGRPVVLGAGVVSEVSANAARVERNYYTGDQLSGLTALIQQNCTAALKGGQSIEVAGGVGPVTCSVITISGNAAQATCELVKWLRSLIRGPRGVATVRPSGLTIVHDTLARTPGGWRITGEQLAPAPGASP